MREYAPPTSFRRVTRTWHARFRASYACVCVVLAVSCKDDPSASDDTESSSSDGESADVGDGTAEDATGTEASTEATSDPAPASVVATVAMRSPLASSDNQRDFCASVPAR